MANRSIRRRSRLAALTAVLALVLVACGGGDGDDNGDETSPQTPANGGSENALADRCPLGAIDEAGDTPVQITMWHSMTAALQETLEQLVTKFHDSQDDVRVRLVNQTSYQDTLTQYRAALGGGNLPDLVQIQAEETRLMIDSQSVLPAQACVEAEGYDLSDHVERAVAYFTVDDVLWPMPFNVSNPVLYYDIAAFERAGLDPEAPPSTLDELRAASEQIVETGTANSGFAFKADAWFLEQWFAKAGEIFVNNSNGRDGRATEVAFDNEVGRDLFEWIDGMSDDGLMQPTPPAESNFDNLLAIGNQTSAMTIETTAALGTILDVLSQGQFPDVELGVAPMPGPEGEGGVLIGGGALYITDDAPPERQEAAWRFAKFLNEPEQQAEWSAGTGYVPIRKSAADQPVLQQRWEEVPEFRVAFDQLLSGVENDATAGAVIGDREAVRQALIRALESLFRQGAAPEEALSQAAQEANDAISDYESRIGG